jgi:Fur family ferric uptake transcriptional regulator/Fur family peroxide stress response transcriptional regulator
MQNRNLEILKAYHLKATPQRLEILSAIDSLGHANIDEIYEVAKKRHSTMSLATVYKNVTALLEKNVLKEVALNNFKSKYEIAKDTHAHLVCKECGGVEDIDLNKSIYNESKSLAKNRDFDFNEVELNIYGICSKCKA